MLETKSSQNISAVKHTPSSITRKLCRTELCSSNSTMQGINIITETCWNISLCLSTAVGLSLVIHVLHCVKQDSGPFILSSVHNFVLVSILKLCETQIYKAMCMLLFPLPGINTNQDFLIFIV